MRESIASRLSQYQSTIIACVFDERNKTRLRQEYFVLYTIVLFRASPGTMSSYEHPLTTTVENGLASMHLYEMFEPTKHERGWTWREYGRSCLKIQHDYGTYALHGRVTTERNILMPDWTPESHMSTTNVQVIE
jgi:hypothetical protein